MFKRIFLLCVSAGLFSALVSFVYVSFYKGIIVDFTEAAGVKQLLSYNILFAMVACFINFGLSKAIRKEKIASFIFNFILSSISIGLVFYVLKMDDPTFKNEDAELMKDFFKGFLMPMLFFPALSWFSFKPLFQN